MIYVGLTKGIINATAHWYLAVTEDGTTFKNEDKDTLKEVASNMKAKAIRCTSIIWAST